MVLVGFGDLAVFDAVSDSWGSMLRISGKSSS